MTTTSFIVQEWSSTFRAKVDTMQATSMTAWSPTAFKTVSCNHLRGIGVLARHQSKTIALVNGCWDCYGLTVGHLRTLQFAASHADVVVASSNSDLSISLLKGPGRPVTGINDRLFMLASTIYVDYAVEQESVTPIEIISLLRPHYLVKGGDTDPQDAVGAGLGLQGLVDLGCELLLSDKIDCLHSSEILNHS